MWSLAAGKTSGRSPVTATVEGGRHLIPLASWFMGPRILALRTVWGRGRRQFNLWTQKLRSGKTSMFLKQMFALFRGAATKTELSLVDKIELARTYQPMTGKKIWIWKVPNEFFQSMSVSPWTTFDNMPSIWNHWGVLCVRSKPMASALFLSDPAIQYLGSDLWVLMSIHLSIRDLVET